MRPPTSHVVLDLVEPAVYLVQTARAGVQLALPRLHVVLVHVAHDPLAVLHQVVVQQVLELVLLAFKLKWELWDKRIDRMLEMISNAPTNAKEGIVKLTY